MGKGEVYRNPERSAKLMKGKFLIKAAAFVLVEFNLYWNRLPSLCHHYCLQFAEMFASAYRYIVSIKALMRLNNIAFDAFN